ncbi:MAG: polyprenyl diphosphate synthase [Asticcacaulis sp.]
MSSLPPPAETAPSEVTRESLHVAIIMDGNGRWAKSRNQPRSFGHHAGVEALKRTVRAAPDLGITCLTVYAFSTENWRRPVAEVSELMGLLKLYVKQDLDRLEKDGVRVKIIGSRRGLPHDVAEIVDLAERRTAKNHRFLLQVAFNYGAQTDILEACQAFAEAVHRGEMEAGALTADTFSRYLSTRESPPLDLLVRTSGEKRISNFLLWEAAYAEFVFQDVMWPDYGEGPLREALAEYAGRDRRYGGVRTGHAATAV